jgi:chitin synthase
VVCIVVGGVDQIHPKTLEVLAAMCAYQEGLLKSQIGLKEVMANVYEYTTPGVYVDISTSWNYNVLSLCTSRPGRTFAQD